MKTENTELQVAKEWFFQKRFTSRQRLIRLYRHSDKESEDTIISRAFRKEVIEPWWKENKGTAITDFLRNVTEPERFEIYSKEVLDKEDSGPWLNQYDYDQIQEKIAREVSGKTKFTRLVTAIAENDAETPEKMKDTRQAAEKTSISQFVKEWMDGYGDDTFVANEHGNYIYYSGASGLNLKVFFEELLKDFIESQPSEPTTQKSDLLGKLEELKERYSEILRKIEGLGSLETHHACEGVIRDINEILKTQNQ